MTKTLALTALAVLQACGSPTQPTSSIELFHDAPPVRPAGVQSAYFRCRFVYIDFDLLMRTTQPGGVLRLALFEDRVYDAVLDQFGPGAGPPTDPPSFFWAGHVQGEDFSSVSLGFRGRSLVGAVRVPRLRTVQYEIYRAGGDVHVIYEVDLTRIDSMPTCSTGLGDHGELGGA